MVARINTVAFQGVDVRPVDVQVQISNGLPAFSIVGLPDKAVAESKERVRAALHALGIALPPKRLTVNLAPADVSKEGSHFDLPIALGVMAALDIIPANELERYVVLGELALDASIRSVAGVLPAALHAGENDNHLICPKACGGEAAWAGDVDILAPQDLLQLINHMKGVQVLSRPEARLTTDDEVLRVPDLSEVKGQEMAKRALEIAAAGGHNLMMCGPPGSGKSMLASCLPGILPPLLPAEALQASMIHSLAGTLPEGGLIKTRPFRDPHHSASLPALIGGGQKAKPGEISLAHCGVLFLDELPEFARSTLESLRQPMETGKALVARVNQHVMYPANFQLIAAMNPCRCGYLGDPDLECTRAPRCGLDYQAKISGPLMDRFDLRVDVSAVTVAELGRKSGGESSETVRDRIMKARDLQAERFKSFTKEMGGAVINADMPAALIEKVVILEEDSRNMLAQAAEKLKLSARGYYRLLRVARTIADLAANDDTNCKKIVKKSHVAEALGFRPVRMI